MLRCNTVLKEVPHGHAATGSQRADDDDWQDEKARIKNALFGGPQGGPAPLDKERHHYSYTIDADDD